MFKLGMPDILEIDIREDVAHPAGHVQDILEGDGVALSAPLLTAKT